MCHNTSMTNTVATNANERAAIYYCKHMQPGIIAYPAKNEDWLIEQDTMRSMIPSLEGVPVYFGVHPDDKDLIEEVGYICDSYYSSADGWLHAKMVIYNDVAKDAIERNGYSVSNGYDVLKSEGGGVLNGIPYNRKITDGKFFQLSIVDDPRYQDAKIFNQKDYKRYMSELAITAVNKKDLPDKNKSDILADKATSNKGDVMPGDHSDNKEAKSMEEKKETSKTENMSDEKKDKAENSVMDREIEVGDKKMTVANLVKAYNKMAKDYDEAKNKLDKMAKNSEKEKASNEDEKKEEPKEKATNSNSGDWFDAGVQNEPAQEKFEMPLDRYQYGQDRFGSN